MSDCQVRGFRLGWPQRGYGFNYRSNDPTPLSELPITCQSYPSGANASSYFIERCEPVRNADNLFWCTHETGFAARPDLVNRIVLSGEGWDQKLTQGDADYYASMRDRINMQRIQTSDDPQIKRPDYPHKMEVFKGAQKIVNDGILVSWELGFTQAHFTEKGADYIRQYVF